MHARPCHVIHLHMTPPVPSLFKRLIDSVATLFSRPRQRQVAALAWRRGEGGDIEVLTITTRRTKRWSIPRGWPINGLTSAEAAAQEAWEEAGVRGIVAPEPLGHVTYTKSRHSDRPPLRMIASVFALHVAEQATDYPEAGQRKRAWRTRTDAAERLQEPDLKAIVQAFDP